MEEIVITCSCCGHKEAYPVQKESVRCRSCRQPIIPMNYKDAKEVPAQQKVKQILLLNQAAAANPTAPEINMALGLFYLTSGAYQYALPQFNKVIEADPFNADAYFYASVALLGGTKPFVKNLHEIEKIVENLKVAEQIEQKAIYYYLHAYVAYDYYKRKYLGCNPRYTELLSEAQALGITGAEITDLFELLKTDKPSNF